MMLEAYGELLAGRIQLRWQRVAGQPGELSASPEGRGETQGQGVWGHGTWLCACSWAEVGVLAEAS